MHPLLSPKLLVPQLRALIQNIMITNGAMPLDILEQQVDRWLASKTEYQG